MSQSTTTHDRQETDDQVPVPQTKTAEEVTQEEMQKRYIEQQRRLACPGCGEAPFLG